MSGSEGWYLKSDYRWQWSASNDKTASFNVGLDIGETDCEIDNQDLCGDISGFGLGGSLSDPNFAAQLLIGIPLRDLAQSQADDQQLLLSMQWRL